MAERGLHWVRDLLYFFPTAYDDYRRVFAVPELVGLPEGTAVVVRGKVVKYTGEVLGKNWIHLRDGSGSAADGSDDILVTTKNEAKIGDVVLVKGVVHLDRDFGAGYAYQVLIEDASLQK